MASGTVRKSFSYRSKLHRNICFIAKPPRSRSLFGTHLDKNPLSMVQGARYHLLACFKSWGSLTITLSDDERPCPKIRMREHHNFPAEGNQVLSEKGGA